MLWVATERAAYLGVGALLFGVAAYVRVDASSPTCRSGSTNWLDPWKDRTPTRACRSSRRGTPWPGAAWPAPASALGQPDKIPVV